MNENTGKDATGDGSKPRRGGRTVGIVNRERLRKYALDFAEGIGRGDVVKQVGNSVYVAAEIAARNVVRRLVHAHPTGWRTLEA